MKIKKVMLINPSNTMPKDSVRRLAPPIGILYIAAVLEKNGYDVKVIDSTCEGYYNTKVSGDYVTYGLSDEDIIERIRDYAPDVIGVSSMFSARQNMAIHYCDIIKDIDENIITILGGIHPSLFPMESIQNKSVDFVIIGEGEFRSATLLDMLNQGKTTFDFDGIAYKDKHGKVVLNPITTKIENLDDIPFPARHLVDFEKYMNIGVPYGPFARRERTCQIMTSRGCPFNCVFCSTVRFWGHKFRMRSVENVVKEIDYMVKKYGVEEVQFTDDNITVHKKRAREIFERIKPYNLSWCTPNGLMVKTLDKDMIKLMADSGAYQLTFAIESGSRRVLKEIINKNVPPKEEVRALVEQAQGYGVQVHGMFIVGFPGEAKSEMLETLNYPFDVKFNSVSFFIASPTPGSRLHEYCQKKGYLVDSGKIDFKTSEIVIPKDSPEYVISSDDLTKMVDDKTREFNEFSKKLFSHQWKEKFDVFLKKHPEQKEKLLGRVT